VGIRLIYDGDTCPIRAEGLRLIRKDGQGESALEAIKAAESRMPENACMRRALKKGLVEIKNKDGKKAPK
jgi:hypothetical protein